MYYNERKPHYLYASYLSNASSKLSVGVQHIWLETKLPIQGSVAKGCKLLAIYGEKCQGQGAYVSMNDLSNSSRQRRRRRASTASVTSVIDPVNDVREGDQLARQSDATVGGGAVPAETEYFGFALYVGSSFVGLVYIVWAYFPAIWQTSFDISFFPSRWWAVAIPAYTVMLLVYIYIALALYNTEVLTKDAAELTTISDLYAKIPPHSKLDQCIWHGTDGVWDLPLGAVCDVLYSDPPVQDSANQPNGR